MERKIIAYSLSSKSKQKAKRHFHLNGGDYLSNERDRLIWFPCLHDNETMTENDIKIFSNYTKENTDTIIYVWIREWNDYAEYYFYKGKMWFFCSIEYWLPDLAYLCALSSARKCVMDNLLYESFDVFESLMDTLQDLYCISLQKHSHQINSFEELQNLVYNLLRK